MGEESLPAQSTNRPARPNTPEQFKYELIEVALILTGFLGIVGAMTGIATLVIMHPKASDPAAISLYVSFGVVISGALTKYVIGQCPLAYLSHMSTTTPEGRRRVMRANPVLRLCSNCFGSSKRAFTLSILCCMTLVMLMGSALVGLAVGILSG